MRRTPGLAPIAMMLALSACGPQETAAEKEQREASAKEASARLAAAPSAFRPCLSCHTIEPGRNGSGPSLAGVMGRRAGSLPGYPFSPALQRSTIVWDRQAMDRWLAAPMKMVPGTRMVMPVPDPGDRAEVVRFLETLD